MKRKNTLFKIVIAFTIFSLGASLLSNHFVKYKELDATQHASNYSYYVYSGDYYSKHKIDFNAAQGMNGALRTKLTSEIVPAQFPTYSGSGTNTISDLFQDSEQDPTNGNNMIYFYTRDSVAKTAGTVNGTVIWNREHVWPKSLSNNNWKANTNGATTNAGTDLLHLRPTYQSTNSSRGNTKYGQTGSNHEVKDYNGMIWGYTGNDCFEPIDANKGDVARIIMYVWTAYQDFSGYNPISITDVFDSYDTLLTWHTQDKPDVLEGHRNDIAEASLQKNRNPFVDHPELAWKIFGDQVSSSVKSACQSTYPSTGYDPGPDDEVLATSITVSPSTLKLLPNEQRQLTATVNPTDCTETVTWSSSNTSIATVDNSGKVTIKPSAQAGSTVNITATVGSYSDSCAITVKSASADQNGYVLYNDTITEGDYIVHYNGKSMKATISNSRLGYMDDTPAEDTFPLDTDASVIWHIAPNGNYWTIYNASVNKYAASTGGSGKAALVNSADNNDKALWTFEKQSNGTFEIVNKYNADNSVNSTLRNNGTYGFACYSTQTGGSLSLYKKAENITPIDPNEEVISSLDTTTSLSYSYSKEERPEIVTDTITKSLITFNGTSYADWSNITGTSGAVYTGNSYSSSTSIQFRTSSDSGMITTTSGGLAKKVTVEWGSSTLDARQIDIYGKNTPYSSVSDLFDTSKRGTLIGSIAKANATELVISGDYNYIGIKSNDGALYLSSININWQTNNLVESFAYTNTALRFGGFMIKDLWDELDTDQHVIDGYGVLLAKTNSLDGETLTPSNALHDLFVSKNSKPNPSLASDGQKETNNVSDITEDYYVWSLRVNVQEKDFKTSLTAVAYIKVGDKYYYFKETSTSVQELALDYINNRGYGLDTDEGALNHLARL